MVYWNSWYLKSLDPAEFCRVLARVMDHIRNIRMLDQFRGMVLHTKRSLLPFPTKYKFKWHTDVHWIKNAQYQKQFYFWNFQLTKTLFQDMKCRHKQSGFSSYVDFGSNNGVCSETLCVTWHLQGQFYNVYHGNSKSQKYDFPLIKFYFICNHEISLYLYMCVQSKHRQGK